MNTYCTSAATWCTPTYVRTYVPTAPLQALHFSMYTYAPIVQGAEHVETQILYINETANFSTHMLECVYFCTLPNIGEQFNSFQTVEMCTHVQ